MKMSIQTPKPTHLTNQSKDIYMTAKASATAAPPTASIGPLVITAAPAVEVDVEVALGASVPLDPLA